MQGDTLVGYKNARTQSPKQKKNKSITKKEISFREGTTVNKISNSKNYKQSDLLGNGVLFENSKRSYTVTCPNAEKKKINEKSSKFFNLLKHDSKGNSKTCKCKTVFETNDKLEIKPKELIFCQGGPCSGANRCSRPRECACSGNKKRSTVDEAAKIKINIPDGKRKQKNKVTLLHDSKQNENAKVENVFAEGPKHRQDVCKEGVCFEALKNKNRFICRCKIRKQNKSTSEGNECTDINCNVTNKSYLESNTTIGKLRTKILCLCQEYSQKIKETRRSTVNSLPNDKKSCKTGLCKEALNMPNKSFKCFCKKKQEGESINEISAIKPDTLQRKVGVCDEDCDLEKGYIRNAEASNSIIKRICRRCRSKNVRNSFKSMRQPLDTRKVLSGIKSKTENWSILKIRTSGPGNTECQGITPSLFKTMQRSTGLKISVNDKYKRDVRICHCKKCKRKSNVLQQQPVKGKTLVQGGANECGDINCGKQTRNDSTYSCGACCKCKKKNSMINKCQTFVCSSFANFKRKRKLKQSGTSKKRKEGIYKKQKEALKGKTKAKKEPIKKKKSNTICKCHHECQCDLALKEKKKKKKRKPKFDPRKALEKKKKKNEAEKKLLKGDAKFNKEVRRKEKAEKKKEMKLQKLQLKELERLSEGKDQMQDTSCLADFFLGIIKTAFNVVKTLIFVVFSFITKPKVTCRYIKGRARDPQGTYERIKKWSREAWQMKKLQMAKTVGGSETMTIFGDTIKDSATYQAFANKGKTKKERQKFELEKKMRKKRIRRRNDQALYSCKHNLLTTLRKTPCLWVYHVCPGCYPQCLSLLAFWKKFSNMLLFCLAFAVWTPCIVACELCRGLMCCTLCMG